MKFNIIKFLENRPLSYSAINTFSDPQYGSPEKWFDTYILGKRQTSKELDFGSVVDKRLQNDKHFLPDVPRYEEMQYKMKVIFAGIPLVGIPDGLNLRDKKELADFKTGKAKWTKKRADETGQLTFYLLLLYISLKIKPEEFVLYIHWLETRETGDFKIDFVKDMKCQTFKTKRTMLDLLEYGEKIKRTVKDMEDYVNTRIKDVPPELIHTPVSHLS